MWCNKCEADKDASEFYKNKTRSTGYSGFCKICMRGYDTKENSRRTSKRYYDNHKSKSFAKSAAYRAAKLKATPKWLTSEMKEEIENLYDEARKLGHHVDHIIPLKAKNACGLHVP